MHSSLFTTSFPLIFSIFGFTLRLLIHMDLSLCRVTELYLFAFTKLSPVSMHSTLFIIFSSMRFIVFDFTLELLLLPSSQSCRRGTGLVYSVALTVRHTEAIPRIPLSLPDIHSYPNHPTSFLSPLRMFPGEGPAFCWVSFGLAFFLLKCPTLTSAHTRYLCCFATKLHQSIKHTPKVTSQIKGHFQFSVFTCLE